jgi:hypothetical protein
MGDDNTTCQTQLARERNITNSDITCVLGTSDNINFEQFKKELDRERISWVDIDNLKSIDKNIITLVVVGNSENYDTVLDYLEVNKYDKLTSVPVYGRYKSLKQTERTEKMGYIKSTPFIGNNSSQPFLESEYSTISRPPYVENSTNFFDLSNLILRFTPDFLFTYGYIIDI